MNRGVTASPSSDSTTSQAATSLLSIHPVVNPLVANVPVSSFRNPCTLARGTRPRRSVFLTTISAVTCSTDKKQGRIFGTATINGAGSFQFRIDVKDLGEPGTNDTYRIRLSNGYDSGEKKLEGGNIQIHK